MGSSFAIPCAMHIYIALSALIHLNAVLWIPAWDPAGSDVVEQYKKMGFDELDSETEKLNPEEIKKRKESIEQGLVKLAQDYLLLERLKREGRSNEKFYKRIRQKISQVVRPFNVNRDRGQERFTGDDFFSWFFLFKDLMDFESGQEAKDKLESVTKELDAFAKKLKQKERQFSRIYVKGSTPEWLVRLNYRRKILHDEFFHSSLEGQASLVDLIRSKAANGFAQSALIFGIYNDNNWFEDLPDHQLGVRVFNDHIEPVVIVNSPLESGKKLSMNLLTGETQYLELTEGNIYQPLAWLQGFINHHKQESPLTKEELLISESALEPEYNLLWESTKEFWYRDIRGVEPEKQGAFVGTQYYPGKEAFDYASGNLTADERLSKKLENFKALALWPNIEIEEEEEVVADSGQESGGSPEEESKSADESKSEIDEAMETLTGKDTENMSKDEKVQATQEMLESAESMAKLAGDEALLEMIGDMDPELFAQAEEDPESLNAEQLKQLDQMSDVLKKLAERKAKSGDSPDFVADPVIRVATRDELENSFGEYDPFVILWPELEKRIERETKSRTRQSVEDGFDYFLLQPEFDIVLRSQREVDILKTMGFKEKFHRLLAYADESLAEILEELERVYTPDQISKILLISLENDSSNNLRKPRNWNELLRLMESARSIIEFTNLLITNVYRYSMKYETDLGSEVYYYDHESFRSLYQVMPRLNQLVVKDPLGFIEDLNTNNQRETLLRLLIYLQKWQKVFLASVNGPSSTELEDQYEDSWAAIVNFWEKDFFEIYEKSRSEFSRFQSYLPDEGDQKYGKDLFAPLTPLLPFIADEKWVKILTQTDDVYTCQKTKPWINLPQADMGYSQAAQEIGYQNVKEWAEVEGERCLVTYYEMSDSGPDEIEEVGKFVELTIGHHLVQKLPFVENQQESTEKLEEGETEENESRVFVGPSTYAALVLAQVPSQLNHPLAQYILIQRFNEDVASNIANKYVAINSDATKALLNLPQWNAHEDLNIIMNPYLDLEDSTKEILSKLRDQLEIKTLDFYRALSEDEYYEYTEDVGDEEIFLRESEIKESPISLVRKDIQLRWSQNPWPGLGEKNNYTLFLNCETAYSVEEQINYSTEEGETSHHYVRKLDEISSNICGENTNASQPMAPKSTGIDLMPVDPTTTQTLNPAPLKEDDLSLDAEPIPLGDDTLPMSLEPIPIE